MNHIVLSFLISGISFLDQKPIYTNPLANIRAPELGLSIDTAKYLGDRIYYLEGIIGRTVPVVTYQNDSKLKLQLALEASAWVMLGYEDGAFPLLTEDFYFSVPICFKFERFSGGVKFNHISAHKGDGLDKLVKKTLSVEERERLESLERLTGLGPASIPIFNARAYSRDFWSFHFAYEYSIKKFRVKSHFHGGYIHKSIPNELKRLFFGHSSDMIYGTRDVMPYYAYDATYNQDVDSFDYSGQLGLMFFNPDNKFYEARFALKMHIGSDRRGQFIGRKLKEFSVGIFIR